MSRGNMSRGKYVLGIHSSGQQWRFQGDGSVSCSYREVPLSVFDRKRDKTENTNRKILNFKAFTPLQKVSDIHHQTPNSSYLCPHITLMINNIKT